MDKLVDDAVKYCEILHSSSSPQVENWKIEDLERALHWAEYFRKVQGRISQKQSVVQSLDAQLKQVGRKQLCRRFGGEEFSCDFLGHSSDYLVRALLDNPVLPAELRAKILAEHAPPGSQHHMHAEKFASNCALLRTLSLMHAKLMPSPPHSSTDTQTVLLTVDALCLQDDINWQLQSVSSNPRLVDTGVQKRLLELSKEGNGMKVILLALIQDNTSLATEKTCQSGLVGSPIKLASHDLPKVKGVILKWLLEEVSKSPTATGLLELGDHRASGSCKESESFDSKLWEQPPQLLAEVSSNHFEFFKAHLQFLIQTMDVLGATAWYTSLNLSTPSSDVASKAGAWERQFETVVSHFRVLAAMGGRIETVSTSLIESRVPTSVFNVKGDTVSPPAQDVWSKLYFALNSARFST